jgi:hypothetical protein
MNKWKSSFGLFFGNQFLRFFAFFFPPNLIFRKKIGFLRLD